MVSQPFQPIGLLQNAINAVDISASLVSGLTTVAAANAAAINAAIALANSAIGLPNLAINVPGIYYPGQIVMMSNVTLTIGLGVTLRKVANTPASLIINWGALQSTPVRDSNIGLYGAGTIDGNGYNQSSGTRANNGTISANTFLYGIMGDIAMINVDHFTCAIRNFSNSNGSCVQFIGTDAHFVGMRPDTLQDVIHLNGPSSDITIDDMKGYSADAFIAVNAWDWHNSSPSVGDITDVKIRGCEYYGSNGTGGAARTNAFLVLLPGTRTTGVGTGTGNIANVQVDGFKVDMTKGTVTAASPAFWLQQTIDAANGAEYSGTGEIRNVRARCGTVMVPNSNCRGVSLSGSGLTASGQCTTTVHDVKFEDVHFDASSGTTGYIINEAASTYDYWNIAGLKFKDCEWTPPAGTSTTTAAFVNWIVKTPTDGLSVDGLQIRPNTLTGHVAAVHVGQYSSGNPATITDLTLDRVTTAHGYQLPGAWLLVEGVVTKLRSRGNIITGPAGGMDAQGIALINATAQIVDGVVSDGYFNGVKTGLYISNAVSSSPAARITFRDCDFNNCTHPAFMAGAYTMDVTYSGGSINTATNLARVQSGSAVLSYTDTVASGAGDNAITLVSGGTVELRKTDRIQVSATGIVLSPQNNDTVNFAGTPAYTGANVISGTGAGLYVYRGTGTAGWLKLN